MTQCHVCKLDLQSPIFVSSGPVSITSLCSLYPKKAQVYFCERCGHVQTEEVANIDSYYDKQYNILTESEEEDQLYKVVDGKKVFRLEHQAATLLRKLQIPQGARILDYGCAKGASIRSVLTVRPDIVAYLFDVSEAYKPFWDRFVPPSQYAVYDPKPEWSSLFDVVTSFFSLEHVSEPRAMIATVRKLLRPGGAFYCVVPNVDTNIADFVVIDHVNHFTSNSLRYLLSAEGLELQEIDTSAHDGAFVLVARKAERVAPYSSEADSSTRMRINEIRNYWENISNKVRGFEKAHACEGPAAIYGAGFYGTYISTCLQDMQNVKYFVDQNPFLQGKTVLGRPVVPPDALAESVRLVYVGLRPEIAQRNIEAIPSFRGRPLRYFFL